MAEYKAPGIPSPSVAKANIAYAREKRIAHVVATVSAAVADVMNTGGSQLRPAGLFAAREPTAIVSSWKPPPDHDDYRDVLYAGLALVITEIQKAGWECDGVHNEWLKWRHPPEPG